MSGTRDPAAVVVPFGKHKGTTVAELLEKDPQYANWLMAQGWLAERFAELHAAILTRGAAPDDTPEHNAIQGRFLDPLFRAALVLTVIDPNELANARQRHWAHLAEDAADRRQTAERRLNGYQYPPLTDDQKRLAEKVLAQAQRAVDNPPKPGLATSVVFEDRGIDAIMKWDFGSRYDHHWDKCTLRIEIKPSLGEDYPTVMRQMRRLGVPYLLLGTYTGRALSLDALRSMFAANSQKVVLVQEIEAEIANARAIVELQRNAP